MAMAGIIVSVSRGCSYSYRTGYAGRFRVVHRCSGRDSSSGLDAVFKQIQEIGDGLKELSRSQISGHRVNRLVRRLEMLNNGIHRALSDNGSVPAPLMAALNALQREQLSLARIVQLATASLVDHEEEANHLLSCNSYPQPIKVLADCPSKDVINSLERESCLAPVKQAVYEMSTPLGEISTEMASIRAEIESRVTQQLLARNEELFPSRPEKRPERVTTDPKKVFNNEIEKFGMAEQQLRTLEAQVGRTVQLEVHESVVNKLRESLHQAHMTVIRLTEELTDKEKILASVKENVLKEARLFLEKVSHLRHRIAHGKSDTETLELAVNDVVDEFFRKLPQSQNKAAVLATEKRELQLKEDGTIDTGSLREQLMITRKQLKELEEARKAEQSQLLQAYHKISVLENELASLRQNYREAEARRKRQKQESLTKMKVLITEMVKIHRSRSERDAQVSDLLTKVAASGKNRPPQPGHDSDLSSVSGGNLPSSEKMKVLRIFFFVMKQLLERTNTEA